MLVRPLRTTVALVLALAVAAGTAPRATQPAADLPARLTDREFWGLVEGFSEADGFFRSDNLVSNEDTFQHVIPALTRVVKPGGVYMGVGPDQNFTYIAAVRPKIAFIPDIRRGNLQAHLMYKALFELSATRAEFLARLFAKPVPAGVPATASAEQLFDAFAMLAASEKLREQHLGALLGHLRGKRGLPLDEADAAGIAYVYSAFAQSGPFLSYSSGPPPFRGSRYPTYQDLQMADDGLGRQWAYLASEEHYRVIRTLQQQNLIVPLVGNFAGWKTLRAVGAWVRARGATVTTFYASNVEQYLFGDRLWDEFGRNLASLPLDETSTLIRSCFNNQCRTPPGSRSVSMLDGISALVRDHQAGRVQFYADVLSRSRTR
jgi:hypothetical protein